MLRMVVRLELRRFVVLALQVFVPGTFILMEVLWPYFGYSESHWF